MTKKKTLKEMAHETRKEQPPEEEKIDLEENGDFFTDDKFEEREVKTIEYTKKDKKIIDMTKNSNEPPMTTAMTISEPLKALPATLTLEDKKKAIVQSINLFEFVISQILKPSDYHTYKNGKEHIKRSGCQKLATAFSLTTETLSITVEKEYDKEGNLVDVHATAYVKATRPNGSFVIMQGTKSKSEYWSEKYQNFGSYSLHNLRATAETKGSNRATLNAVGFGMVSADEIGYDNTIYDKDEDFDDSDDFF